LTIIPRSQRTHLPPSGSQLPEPSLIRVNTAGAEGRSIAGLGDTIQRLGLAAQRINDNAEYEKAVISQQRNINDIVARNTLSIKDPVQYKSQTTQDINNSISQAIKNIGFRNKKKFENINQQILLNAEREVNSQYLKKTVDVSNAQYTLSSSELSNAFLSGTISDVEAISAADVLIKDRFNSGVWDSERSIKEANDFRVNIVRLDFLKNYESDPQGAVDKLNKSQLLTPEQKIEIQYKLAGRIAKAEKAQVKLAKERNEKIEGEARILARKGQLNTEEADQLLRAGVLDIDGHTSMVKIIQGIDASGGVSHSDLKNLLISNILQDYESVPENIIKQMADRGDLNRDEEQEVMNEIRLAKNNQSIYKSEEFKVVVSDLKALYGVTDLFGVFPIEQKQRGVTALQLLRKKVIEEEMPPLIAFGEVLDAIPLPEGAITMEGLKADADRLETRRGDGDFIGNEEKYHRLKVELKKKHDYLNLVRSIKENAKRGR